MNPKRGPGREGRDGNERDRDRKDMAFNLAKKMQDMERKKLEAKGVSPEEIKARLNPIWQTADLLLKNQAEELDKMIRAKKEALGQYAGKSKKSLSNLGQRTASEINNIGSKFKGILEGKRNLRNREKEKNDTGSEKKSSQQREPSLAKENKPKGEIPSKRKNPEGREGKDKRNQSDSQTPISVKDLFKGVRKLQKEKAAAQQESAGPKELVRRKDIEKTEQRQKESERKEVEPRPIRTKSEYEEFKKRHPHVEDMPHWFRFGEFQTQQEFDKAQENYPYLESKKSFEKQIDESKQYFADKLKGKETPKPAFVKKIEAREGRRIYEAVHKGPPEAKIESIQDVDKLLDKDPEKRKHHNFREQYHHDKVYFEVTDDWSKMEKELAHEHDVSESTICNYRRKYEPYLISNLRKSEETRIINDWIETTSVDEIHGDVSNPEIERKNLGINPQIRNIDLESIN
ncbi:MAG: hypothetical protein E4H14_10010, partial [Candidatus Thorarchaeota archaeon]